MPITSRATYHSFLADDLRAHGLDRLPWTVRLGVDKPTLCWQRRLRYVEYLVNCHPSRLWRPWVLFQKWRLLRLGMTLGFDIPPNVFGPGLCLVHWGTVTVSALARVGANCRMHPSSCIGEHEGAAPTLGDGCYIGPGAKLFGGIHLGDRVTVGANAVVTRSFPDGVTIVGAPARVIGSTR